MSASRTFFALGSLAYGYAVNGERSLSSACYAAAVYLGLRGQPPQMWEFLTQEVRDIVVRELRLQPGVTTADVRLLVVTTSRTFPKPSEYG